jgi:hypothetical protein
MENIQLGTYLHGNSQESKVEVEKSLRARGNFWVPGSLSKNFGRIVISNKLKSILRERPVLLYALLKTS